MKDAEDEAFDELAKRQGAWGGGYQAKRKAAADKLQEPAQECPNLKNCEGACFQCEYFTAETGKTEYPAPQPVQEPVAYRPCRSCNGTGDQDTGIPESPVATCKPCKGTGQIATAPPLPVRPQQDKSDLLTIAYQSGFYDGKKAALAQPAQEPVAYVTGMSFGRFIVEPLNPAMVLPVGMALYSSSQGNT